MNARYALDISALFPTREYKKATNIHLQCFGALVLSGARRGDSTLGWWRQNFVPFSSTQSFQISAFTI